MEGHLYRTDSLCCGNGSGSRGLLYSFSRPFLDTIATPTAIAIGTAITAAFLPDTDPLLKWTLVAIAGGGTAGTIQGLTGFARLSSTALTIGLSNSVVATIESCGAFILSILAIILPFLAISLAAILIIVSLSKIIRVFAFEKRGNKIEFIKPTNNE